MSRWFRMDDDVVNDPKVQNLPDPLFRAWVNILCVASKHDGVLPPLRDVAFILRLKEPAAAAILSKLHLAGLLDKTESSFKPHNWEGRQFKSDRDATAADRAKRYRDAKRDRHGTVTRDASRQETETSRSPETETETEAETDSKANALGAHAPRERADERFAEFWLAYPRRDGPNPRKPAEQRFSSLVKAGVDPRMMIEAAKKLAVDEAARGNVGTRFIPQAVTWLNQQRWADHAAVAAQQQAEAAEHLASQVHVKADTPQWRAWASHLGKSPPQDRNFGWYFDSEWPPGHVPKGAESTAENFEQAGQA